MPVQTLEAAPRSGLDGHATQLPPLPGECSAPAGKPADEPSASDDLYRQLRAHVQRRCSPAKLFEVTAAYLAGRMGAEFVAFSQSTTPIAVVGATETRRYWQDLFQPLCVRASHDERPLMKFCREDGARPSACLIAVPLVQEDTSGPHVVLTAATEQVSLHGGQASFAHLQHVGWLLQSMLDQLGRETAVGDSIRFQLLQRSSSYREVQPFAFAIANGLLGEFGFGGVALGTVHQGHVRLQCVAGLTGFASQGERSRDLIQSMEESLDAHKAVCVQSAAHRCEHPHDRHALTERWQQSVPQASVASIPLANAGGEFVAVVSVQSRNQQPLTTTQLSRVSQLCGPLTAALELIQHANRPLWKHAYDTSRRVWRQLVGRHRVARLLMAACVVALGIWLAYGKMDYVVRVPCQVTSAEELHLTAPYAGRLRAIHAFPGDRVEQGQVLAQMDTTDATLQLERASAQLHAARLALATAASRELPQLIAQALSRVRAAEAEHTLAERRLQDATITAPQAGIILEGSFEQKVGETIPIGEPLFHLADNRNGTLRAHVPEVAVAYLATGQTGSFITYARPDDARNCQLQRIAPRAEVIDGENVFTAVATIPAGQANDLQPGLNGVLRLNTGPQPVWWVWLHRMWDAASIHHWHLLGMTLPTATHRGA